MIALAPLALALSALCLLVLVFHIRRRRTVAVPSLVIWRQLNSGQLRRNRVLQWPKPSWALFLQLLAVLALAAALAQPLWTRGAPVDHWIFVLDRSGAMEGQTEDGSLLDIAKRQISERLATAPAGGEFSLVAVGVDAVPVLAARPLGEAGLSDAVASITAQDAPANWSDVPARIQSLLQKGERTQIVIYSDRAQTLTLPDSKDSIAQESVVPAIALPNAGLTAQLSAKADSSKSWTLTGTIHLGPGMGGAQLIVGFAANGAERPLEWTRRTLGNPLDTSAAASDMTFTLPLDLPGPGIVSVSLAEDGNAYDNGLHFIIGEGPTPLDILYIGAGEQPVLAALKAIDGAAIYQAAGLPDDVSQFALVVADNVHLSRQPETNVLWIGDAGVGTEKLPLLGKVSPTAADMAHPLLRTIAWTGLAANAAYQIAPPDNAEVLLRSGDVPLIVAASHDYGRSVNLAFDPRQSNWPGQPGLPVFAANLVQWLGIAPQGELRAPCLVGQSCTLDARLVGGTMRSLDLATPAAPVSLRNATFTPVAAGLYAIEHGVHRQLLAVNPVVVTASPTSSTSLAVTDFPVPLWPFLIGLVLLVLVVEAIVSGRGGERFMHLAALHSDNPLSTRRRVTAGLRLLSLILVGLALFDIALPLHQSEAHRIAVVAPGGTAIDDADSSVLASATPLLNGAPTADLTTRSGDLAASLQLAAASVPFGEPAQIVVSGVTRSDSDAMLALVDGFAARQMTLDSLAPAPLDDLVSVTALDAPNPVFGGDTFALVGFVHASRDTAATLQFTRDGETLVEQQVALVAGDNRVETILADVVEGSTQYGLAVTASGDTIVDNNSLSTMVDARAAGQVAVIANDPARGEAFVGWLDSQGIPAVALEPDAAPYRLDEWKAYDGAALLDVPAIALTTQQQEHLESAVAEQGLGLLILGGPNSFGPGGYLETPLERASPLSSRVPRDAPEATLIFVLDRSGSMQQPVGNGTRLDIAKQATLAAVRLLNRNSQIGVIVFDSEATAVLPLQRIEDPQVVATALNNVDPGGGTSVYPGLEAAYEMLRNTDTPARHIIVMTDGLSQPADFPGLLAEIRGAGITVSSVSIGKGAERTLIEQIARLGGGTFHATDDFAALPSILSQEAMLLSGSPIEQGRTQPLWAARDEAFLRGLPAQMPPIDGFVLTTAKPEAALSMVVPDSKGEPMPLLASWRYGAGQVLALTTEAVGPWSENWQQLDSYPALWAQAVRAFLPPVERGDVVLNVARRGDSFVAELNVQGKSAGAAPSLMVSGPDGAALSLALRPISANRYAATFTPSSAGPYRFEAKAGAIANTLTMAMGYPAHLGPQAPDAGLRQLIASLGGQFDARTVTPPTPVDRWALHSVWPFWLAAALALFMLELAVRYTSLIKPRQIASKSSSDRQAKATSPSIPEPAQAA